MTISVILLLLAGWPQCLLLGASWICKPPLDHSSHGRTLQAGPRSLPIEVQLTLRSHTSHGPWLSASGTACVCRLGPECCCSSRTPQLPLASLARQLLVVGAVAAGQTRPDVQQCRPLTFCSWSPATEQTGMHFRGRLPKGSMPCRSTHGLPGLGCGRNDATGRLLTPACPCADSSEPDTRPGKVTEMWTLVLGALSEVLTTICMSPSCSLLAP